VDPWEAYVFPHCHHDPHMTTTSYSDSWIGKKYSSVRDIISISLVVFNLGGIFN
jgi:hypothetical protein